MHAAIRRGSTPRRFPGQAHLAGAALLLALNLLAPLPAQAANDDDRLLEVVINGRPTHLQADFIERAGRLFAAVDDLRTLGIRTDGLHPDRDGRVELGAVSGLSWRVDERHQVLRLTLSDRRLVAERVGADGGVPPAALSTPEFGAVLDYQADATAIDGHALTQTALGGRLSTPWAVAGSSWLLATGLPTRTLTRLDTNATVESADSLERWEVGDVVSGGLAWTRPYRLGGAQFASDFGPRPGLVTTPMPALAGHADVASTVDVLVDNVRALSAPVQPGPFQLAQAPVVTGANSVDLVVRDPAGRESVQSLNFYVSPSLLAPGLATFSAEAGWLRPNYGLVQDRYTTPAVSGTIRYGITSWLTGEAHAEASGTLAMAGAGVSVNVFDVAAASLAVAGSTPAGGANGPDTHGAPGGLVSFGLQRTGRVFDVGLSATAASRAFRDVPSLPSDLPPTLQVQAEAGVSWRRLGSFHLALLAVDSPTALGDVVPGENDLVRPGTVRATILSATYTHRLWGRAELAVNAFHDFARGAGSGVTFAISLPLGARRSASVSAGEDGGRPTGAIEAGQSAFSPGQWGWRGTVGRDVGEDADGQVTYVARPATVAGEVDHVDGRTGLRGEATGAIVATPSGVFTANRIGDSYAVIDSGGVPDVGVLEENRPVGRTNADGLLLLPTLTGWQNNHIALDPDDLPADVTAGKLDTTVRLPAAAGGHVRFDLHRGTSALLRLVLADGRPVPVGSSATLRAGTPVPVGHDGEVFLTSLRPRNVLRVRMQHGTCEARFPFRPAAGTLPEIGPFTCRRNDTS